MCDILTLGWKVILIIFSIRDNSRVKDRNNKSHKHASVIFIIPLY